MHFNDGEFIEAYKEKVVEDVYDPVLRKNVSYFDDDGMLYYPISKIMMAMSVVETTSGDIFQESSFGSGRKVVLSRAQEIVASVVSINCAEIERGMMLFKVNPYISAVYECYRSIKPLHPRKVDGSKLPECIRELNKFVAAVRERISSSVFKREISAHIRAANKNYSGLTDYIDALFARYSRLLVLRIDFSYGKGKFEVEDHRASERLDVIRFVTEQIVLHRIELIDYLRNKCPELGMVGYAWKLEYGKEKGHHYHMIFFLDGAKVQQDIVIAKRIGDCWNNVITQGKGLYYNCNGCKDRYKFCGVGMINYNESEKISNLKRAAAYLTKADRYVSACMPGNKRTFGKGNSPKVGERSVGRPRLH